MSKTRQNTTVWQAVFLGKTGSWKNVDGTPEPDSKIRFKNKCVIVPTVWWSVFL